MSPGGSFYHVCKTLHHEACCTATHDMQRLREVVLQIEYDLSERSVLTGSNWNHISPETKVLKSLIKPQKFGL